MNYRNGEAVVAALRNDGSCGGGGSASAVAAPVESLLNAGAAAWLGPDMPDSGAGAGLWSICASTSPDSGATKAPVASTHGTLTVTGCQNSTEKGGEGEWAPGWDDTGCRSATNTRVWPGPGSKLPAASTVHQLEHPSSQKVSSRPCTYLRPLSANRLDIGVEQAVVGSAPHVLVPEKRLDVLLPCHSCHELDLVTGGSGLPVVPQAINGAGSRVCRGDERRSRQQQDCQDRGVRHGWRWKQLLGHGKGAPSNSTRLAGMAEDRRSSIIASIQCRSVTFLGDPEAPPGAS